jgi:hypothetical protein
MDSLDSPDHQVWLELIADLAAEYDRLPLDPRSERDRLWNLIERLNRISAQLITEIMEIQDGL